METNAVFVFSDVSIFSRISRSGFSGTPKRNEEDQIFCCVLYEGERLRVQGLTLFTF